MLENLVTIGLGWKSQDGDRSSSGVLSKDGDLVWVTTEVLNVLLDPIEDHDLILDAHVAGRCLVIGGQEAKGSETVVEGDKDHILK